MAATCYLTSIVQMMQHATAIVTSTTHVVRTFRAPSTVMGTRIPPQLRATKAAQFPTFCVRRGRFRSGPSFAWYPACSAHSKQNVTSEADSQATSIQLMCCPQGSQKSAKCTSASCGVRDDASSDSQSMGLDAKEGTKRRQSPALTGSLQTLACSQAHNQAPAAGFEPASPKDGGFRIRCNTGLCETGVRGCLQSRTSEQRAAALASGHFGSKSQSAVFRAKAPK